MEELDINRLKLLLLAFLVITIGSCIGAAAEIRVHQGDSIQAAVNSASSGDTIIVDPGTYVGNIDISKLNSLNDLVLMSASGNPADTKIIANGSATNVISITRYKNNVTVKGFTISGAKNRMAGIYLDHGKQCIIENNVFLNDDFGVKVNSGSATDGNIILNNIVNRTGAVVNDTVGIEIDGSGNAQVSQNSVSNQDTGIHLTGAISSGSQISGNSINNNGKYGIELEGAKGVTIDRNTVHLNNFIGIYLSSSSGNYVTNNNVDMPSDVVDGTNTNAIQLYSESRTDTNSNIISGNTVSSADHGIFLNGCKNNTIQNNRAFGNNYGIAMRYSSNNIVINNNADGNMHGNGEGLYFTLEDSGNTISGNNASECINGIHLSDLCGANNLVDNNIVNTNQYYGVYVEAPGNRISNNSASGDQRGIFLTGSNCTNNIVSSNDVTQCASNGIYLLNTSNNNKIVSNSVISNGLIGIDLFNSNSSILGSNFAQGNNMGIQLEYSNGVTVNNNTADQNRIGIRFYYSSNNNLTNNNASSSDESGIDFNSATHNTVAGNIITSNGNGITMCPACHYNLVYNNYFDNDPNTGIQGTDNTWYTPKILGKNVVGGPYIGGNYWASPGGDGFSQTAPDTDGDGIANAIYTFNNSYGVTITDRYPLVSVVLPIPDFTFAPAQGPAPLTVQFTDHSQNTDSRIWNFGDGTNNSNDLNPMHIYQSTGNYTVTLTASNKNSSVPKSATVTVQAYVAPPVTPVAAFTANPTSGDSPLTVQFTDSSQNAAGWRWDFGDGTTSTEQSPSHTYYEGTYTVNLVASNANGTSPASTTITVHSGGSHSSSGGGGGGAGGSPEPQNNVEVKELSQTFIASGQTAKFDFPQKVTPVVNISFDSKKTAGKTTTIVEMLKAKSILVSGAPADEVYKYVNMWVGNSGFATPKNIENAVVNFKVEKSWVQNKNIDKSTITLNWYSDKIWNQLPTSLSSEDDNYLYLTAKTTGFSNFAITGKSTGAVQPGADKTQNPAVSETPNNASNGSTAANTQTPEQKGSPTPSPKQSTSLPGFEAVFGVAGLVAVFLYRRK